MSAYLLVSLHAEAWHNAQAKESNQPGNFVVNELREHEWWDEGKGWKNLLNNLRLVLQPYQFYNLLKPWLKVFPIPELTSGFFTLISLMNCLRTSIPDPLCSEDFLFSSA